MTKKRKKDSTPLTPQDGDERVFDEHGEPEELRPDEPAAAPAASETPATPTSFAAEPEPEPAHAPEPEPRREGRGRPRGSTSKNKKRSSGTRDDEAPENISKMLLSIHQMLAAFTDIPELLLSEKEAESMGKAIAEVEALYQDVSFISPEVRAWSNLGITSLMIYWPRYRVIKIRLEKEARAQADIDVTPIRPPTTEPAASDRPQ